MSKIKTFVDMAIGFDNPYKNRNTMLRGISQIENPVKRHAQLRTSQRSGNLIAAIFSLGFAAASVAITVQRAGVVKDEREYVDANWEDEIIDVDEEDFYLAESLDDNYCVEQEGI